MKSKIYNLIILDESGSMSGVKGATINGCNETLNTIRSARQKYADTQDQLVSIYLFQSDSNVPSRYIVKNEEIEKVSDINGEQYEPCGLTPLYDAIGDTLTDLMEVTKAEQLAVGNVTIITDGYENASEHYTHQKVAEMIEDLKQRGWSFNFIGANIDVDRTARSLNIDNAMEFTQDEEGTAAMFEKERKSRMSWFKRTQGVMEDMVEAHYCMSCDASEEAIVEFHKKMREASKDYFENKDED